jgi:Activator of Hsp90 ATPase homolog 1-like protein
VQHRLQRVIGRREYLGFVDVVLQSRIVFTSMLTAGWRPAAPWMPFTVVISMAVEGDGPRYIVTAMHPDQAMRDKHDKMGFCAGWNTCMDQLEAFALQLRWRGTAPEVAERPNRRRQVPRREAQFRFTSPQWPRWR